MFQKCYKGVNKTVNVLGKSEFIHRPKEYDSDDLHKFIWGCGRNTHNQKTYKHMYIV